MNCDNGKFTKAPCRKRAKWAVRHFVPFGHRVGPNGDEPMVMPSIAFRCDDHRASVENSGGWLPVEEYKRVMDLAKGCPR